MRGRGQPSADRPLPLSARPMESPWAAMLTVCFSDAEVGIRKPRFGGLAASLADGYQARAGTLALPAAAGRRLTTRHAARAQVCSPHLTVGRVVLVDKQPARSTVRSSWAWRGRDRAYMFLCLALVQPSALSSAHLGKTRLSCAGHAWTRSARDGARAFPFFFKNFTTKTKILLPRESEMRK